MKKSLLIIFTLFLSFFNLLAQNPEDFTIISIKINDPILKNIISKENVDILMRRNGRVYLLIEKKKLGRFFLRGLRFEFAESELVPPISKHGLNGAYHSYTELERDLFNLEQSYPEIAKIFDIGDSWENRNIYAIKISDNVEFDEDEAEVFFVGCHHAREWISVEIPYLLAHYLLLNYYQNPRIQNIVDNSEIWIVPLLNPDGLEYSITTFRYWRKNRRDNGNGSYGVDLNRNYGYNWGYDNIGSSPNTFSQTYRGLSPFSEPETRAIKNLFEQKNFKAAVSYHSYSQIILYPWGYTEEPSPLNDLLERLSENMANLICQVNGNTYLTGQSGKILYLTNGDATDWILGIYNIPAFTIELPPIDFISGGFFNSEEDIIPIFKENLPAALFLIEWAIENN
ncbi:M14 family metallopeptidase [Candidatus Aminicenantes bacterium AH-873-B07]|nr:M14 family metallopeptidase [Candidatus Aminicenantes bacterium AH-873-B07]